MDPITILLIGAIGLGLATVTFWHQILEWSEQSLFPWFNKYLPTVAPYVRIAFSRLDDAVVTFRRTIKKAWNLVSEYLLKQIVEFNRQTSNTWMKKVTSWVINNSDFFGEKNVEQVTTREQVHWDDLPQDVRQAALKRQRSSFTIDVTDTRDEEMALVE